jgi:flagellar hook protein FlgE
MGKVVVARFQNQQGLTKVGNTDWTQSMQSGQAIYGEAGTSSFGTIASGAIENSNVDIASQLINMIIAQQTYQANAQSITTENTITQAILNIR